MGWSLGRFSSSPITWDLPFLHLPRVAFILVLLVARRLLQFQALHPCIMIPRNREQGDGHDCLPCKSPYQGIASFPEPSFSCLCASSLNFISQNWCTWLPKLQRRLAKWVFDIWNLYDGRHALPVGKKNEWYLFRLESKVVCYITYGQTGLQICGISFPS